MLLLLTLFPAEKEKLLLRYNTENEKGHFITDRTGYLNSDIASTSGIIYSGNHLCFGIQSKNSLKDKIAIYNIYEKQSKIFSCSYSKNIGNIISVYPGKLYLDSKNTNSISSIDFDCVNLTYFNDNIHYALDETKNYGIQSLCNHNSVWFVAQQKMHRIVDLTNDRIVFSDIDTPCCLFFNYNHRLCFIERGRNLFHFGDSIVQVGNNPTAAIEDRDAGGYWIACGSALQFFDYSGRLTDDRDLSKWGEGFNNIIEAEGAFVR